MKRLCCLLLVSWALPAAAQPGSGPWTGVHDRLRATAVVFDDGQVRAAIVAVDLLNPIRAEVKALVQRMLARDGV